MADSTLIFVEGEPVEVGAAGDHDFEFQEGESITDAGKSDLVFVEDTGIGSAVPPRQHLWKFDGDYQDEGENAVAGNTLDDIEGGVSFVTGQENQAVQFDGQDGTGALTDSHNLDGYVGHTIACVVNFDSIGTSHQIVEFSESDGDEVRFEIDSAYGSDFAYVFRVGTDDSTSDTDWTEYVVSTSPPSTGSPTLFVGTYDGSDMVLYQGDTVVDDTPEHYVGGNDVQDGSGSFSTTPEWGSWMGVGNDATSYYTTGNLGQPLDGWVDELAVWDQALTQDEVTALKNDLGL